MDAAEPDSFEQKLAALAEDFRHSLIATRADILAAWAAALAGNDAARTRLLVLVHRVSGSAASFGLPEIADAAEILERRLRQSGATAPPDALMAHAALLEHLAQQLYQTGSR